MYDIRSGYLRDVAIHSTGSSRKNDGVAGCREDRSWMSATVSSAVNLPECIFLPVLSGGWNNMRLSHVSATRFYELIRS
ncbi:hypothetical protein MTP99_015720 [Tenebrio molitor]|nr:hypothetical protein MTP99_015720 [Tenebrio molitor]